MEVIVTEWALQSYLDHKHKRVFTDWDYRNTLRPDVERLHQHPTDPKFQIQGFWGPATDTSGNTIQHAYKMKWHNLGPGNIQLRLGVVIYDGDIFLCQAWVKNSPKVDRREMAKLKRRVRQISLGQYTKRGTL